jgi:hypothetical protein
MMEIEEGTLTGSTLVIRDKEARNYSDEDKVEKHIITKLENTS